MRCFGAEKTRLDSDYTVIVIVIRFVGRKGVSFGVGGGAIR